MESAAQTEAEAARWIARRDAGEWRESDEQALEQWIARSTAHKIAYLRLQTAWTKADRLRALCPSDLLVDNEPEDEIASTEAHRGVLRLAWFGGLGTALVAASAFWLFLGTAADYATPVGGFQRLPLADGSEIELNTDTEIEIAYSQAERRIELDRGEAYFDVAKDKNRPFVVDAGDYRVTAVGTAFSVRRDGEAITVLVTEGRVRIEREDVGVNAAQPVLLSAGEIISARADAPIVSPIAQADYGSELGWREGVLVFHDQPLREVAAEFNRYNRQQLVVLDPDVGAVTVSGRFRATNLPGLTRLLEPGFGIEAVPAGENRLILRFAG